MLRFLTVLTASYALAASAWSQAPQTNGALQQVPLERLSDRSFTALAQRALQVENTWLHSETEHFIYHYTDAATAAAVAVEAEFYYRVIAAELGRDTAKWERKCHLFIFSNEASWAGFQTLGSLDPWTGGIHSQGTLFLLRNKGWLAKANTLAHEISHLVFERFIGSGVPLWLNEGFAEYAASRCQASFYRARGFAARPKVQAVPEALYKPVSELIAYATYPAEVTAVGAFYSQSEKLVRFLANADKKAFYALIEAMGKGARFETALASSFGSRFTSLDALDREFKPYAISQMRSN